MTDELESPDPGAVCPGPPESPYSAGVAWPHTWLPLTMVPSRPIQEGAPELALIEVCPSCLQWRPKLYTRMAVSPQDGG